MRTKVSIGPTGICRHEVMYLQVMSSCNALILEPNGHLNNLSYTPQCTVVSIYR